MQKEADKLALNDCGWRWPKLRKEGNADRTAVFFHEAIA
jgi:hypothetical protein